MSVVYTLAEFIVRQGRLSIEATNAPDQCCWLIVDMTPTGSEPLPPKGVLGPTFRPDAIEGSLSASVRTFIAPEI
jgi:hypothetical protein